MEGLGWIAAIFVGGLAGWIASIIMKAETGIVVNVLLGIVGATVANWVFGFVGIVAAGTWPAQMVVGVIGACLLIGAVRMMRS